jgi:hypothetical protein
MEFQLRGNECGIRLSYTRFPFTYYIMRRLDLDVIVGAAQGGTRGHPAS